MTHHSAGNYRSWVTDPPGFTVNSVQNDTNWYWNGSCVLSSPLPTGAYHYTWLTATGWQKTTSNFNNTYTCTQTDVSSYVLYTDGTFCALNATYVYYNRNHVYGRGNGTLAGHLDWHFLGACTSLLTMHSKLTRTL